MNVFAYIYIYIHIHGAMTLVTLPAPNSTLGMQVLGPRARTSALGRAPRPWPPPPPSGSAALPWPGGFWGLDEAVYLERYV